jgi:hypothetical protein
MDHRARTNAHVAMEGGGAMTTGLSRIGMFVVLAAALSAFGRGQAWADGRCDLNALVGYQIILARPIDGYIQGGVRKKGYEGCEPDRVLVFSDNTGVRCKELFRQHLDRLPTGYLFARDNLADLQLCVEGALFAVSQTN